MREETYKGFSEKLKSAGFDVKKIGFLPICEK